ncbi:alpha/beta hydrolase [Intrasporangium oryzae NRRL B-24470]|uniref:Alpha/beta hydrolase n=1 Tax=Intrasporangium oryzae NRRL B-24470 TaxID=1386089 RepID=W9G653_9MICO|nr:patatin-like phospholipase family protein [Intrasporangium oryzae]EWT01485.1 alpha/beta hydrolase [Intrasporangium oryzae NRRL B-24470]
MTSAFVLSGGGSLGAVQVGMLQALHDRGIRPDLLVGTSVGAVNAAYVAGRGLSQDSLDDLARIWTSMHRRDVFPIEPRRAVLALSGGRPSLFSADRLRHLVESQLTFDDLDTAAIPLSVVTTDLTSGRSVVLSHGDPVGAVLASAAIPGILPPVSHDGRVLVDGGLADHADLVRETGEEVDDIYLLPTGFACALPAPPRSALGSAAQALTLLIQQRLVQAVSRYRAPAVLHVLPALCPLRISPADFRHGGELIDRAHRATAEWLASGGDDRPAPERFLSLHSHLAVDDAPVRRATAR